MAVTEKQERVIPPLEPGRYLRIPDVCHYLDISRTKLYELIDTGEIQRVKIGFSAKVPAESVLAYKQRLESGDDRI